MTLKENSITIPVGAVNLEENTYYWEKDVKEAILKFQKHLDELSNDAWLKNEYKEIFGDFK